MPAHESAELAALKREVQRLSDLEACRRLRVTYFRCLDTANLADLKEILTEDFSCRCVGGDYVYEAKSRAEFLAMTENSFHSEIVTQHNGHGSEVDLVSDTRATALVYFNDLVYHFRSKEFLMGTGLYKDRYRKENGRWRIRADLKRTDRTFLRRLVAIEDSRFWRHDGVDPVAIVRAGGSARARRPRPRRSARPACCRAGGRRSRCRRG